MRVHIKPKVFEGSILEGMPVSYQWSTHRPKNVYYVSRKGIVMRNYESWYSANRLTTVHELRTMFFHDFGHMIYMARNGGIENLKYSNFGRNWDHVHRAPTGEQVYEIKEHFIEEIRVSALEFILKRMDEGKIPLFNEYRLLHSPVFDIMHYNDDIKDAAYLKDRNAIINDAFGYWYDNGLEQIKVLAEQVKTYLREHVVPKA